MRAACRFFRAASAVSPVAEHFGSGAARHGDEAERPHGRPCTGRPPANTKTIPKARATRAARRAALPDAKRKVRGARSDHPFSHHLCPLPQRRAVSGAPVTAARATFLGRCTRSSRAARRSARTASTGTRSRSSAGCRSASGRRSARTPRRGRRRPAHRCPAHREGGRRGPSAPPRPAPGSAAETSRHGRREVRRCQGGRARASSRVKSRAAAEAVQLGVSPPMAPIPRELTWPGARLPRAPAVRLEQRAP